MAGKTVLLWGHGKCFYSSLTKHSISPNISLKRTVLTPDVPVALWNAIVRAMTWGALKLQADVYAVKSPWGARITHCTWRSWRAQFNFPGNTSLSHSELLRGKDIHFTSLWTFSGWINYSIYSSGQIIAKFGRTLGHRNLITIKQQ